jgi:hypothetical protein
VAAVFQDGGRKERTMNDNATLHVPEAAAKSDPASATPGRRIRPGVVFDEDNCVLCGREARYDEAGAILEGEGGPVGECCLWNFRTNAGTGWLTKRAEKFRNLAGLLDALAANPPQMAPPGDWEKSRVLGNARRLIREIGGNPDRLQEEVLGLFAEALEKAEPEDVPF